MAMPRQMLLGATRGVAPMIRGEHIRDDQFQAATMDLRLGHTVDAVEAAFSPEPHRSIKDFVKEISHYNFDLSRDKTHHLDARKIYVVPLMESCELPEDSRMIFSPKSSIGRNDIHVRVMAERWPYYDQTPWGYKGPLWALIASHTFHVGIRAELALVQARIKTKESRPLTSQEIYYAHAHLGIAYDKMGVPLSPHDGVKIRDDSMHFHIDLERDVIGFRAKRNVGKQLDLSAPPHSHDWKEFWERLTRSNGRLVLDPGEFYLLATEERVSLPPELCGELTQVDPNLGEFRVHYAGFFDPGFGLKNKKGTHAVLEVRAMGVPFILQHGKPVCAMSFERMTEVPDQLYGDGGSNYIESGPSLAKHFDHRYGAWTF